MAPDEPADDEPPLTEPVPAVPDSDEPVEPVEPVDDDPDADEPVADEPLAPLDEPLRPPLLPAPLEPMLPVEPLLEPVDGLALDDAPPDRLPDEPAAGDPALADEPVLLLFRLLD